MVLFLALAVYVAVFNTHPASHYIESQLLIDCAYAVMTLHHNNGENCVLPYLYVSSGAETSICPTVGLIACFISLEYKVYK